MAIKEFRGEFAFLSSFFPSIILDGGRAFPTAEHAFQVEKTLDPVWRNRIQFAGTPGQAKRLGRRAPLRPDWDTIKLAHMARIIRLKFTQHPVLAARLLQTGEEELIEGNTWNDRFWGICNGVGENHLGQLLMQLRTELRKEVTL